MEKLLIIAIIICLVLGESYTFIASKYNQKKLPSFTAASR